MSSVPTVLNKNSRNVRFVLLRKNSNEANDNVYCTCVHFGGFYRSQQNKKETMYILTSIFTISTHITFLDGIIFAVTFTVFSSKSFSRTRYISIFTVTWKKTKKTSCMHPETHSSVYWRSRLGKKRLRFQCHGQEYKWKNIMMHSKHMWTESLKDLVLSQNIYHCSYKGDLPVWYRWNSALLLCRSCTDTFGPS